MFVQTNLVTAELFLLHFSQQLEKLFQKGRLQKKKKADCPSAPSGVCSPLCMGVSSTFDIKFLILIDYFMVEKLV